MLLKRSPAMAFAIAVASARWSTRRPDHTSIVIGITVLCGLAITLLLTKLIAPPVRRAVRIAQAIAAGQLDNEIPLKGRGETAELLRALSIMQSSIAEALARINKLMEAQAASHAGELAKQHARLEAALDNMGQRTLSVRLGRTLGGHQPALHRNIRCTPTQGACRNRSARCGSGSVVGKRAGCHTRGTDMRIAGRTSDRRFPAGHRGWRLGRDL